MKTIAQQLNCKVFPLEIHDANNNLIYSETTDGVWYKSENGENFWFRNEYDSNNNLVYSENSKGFWIKYEYDSNKNLIYWEDSDGEWRKQKFDSDNNLTYAEDINGIIPPTKE